MEQKLRNNLNYANEATVSALPQKYFQKQVKHAVPNIPDEITPQLKPSKASENWSRNN